MSCTNQACKRWQNPRYLHGRLLSNSRVVPKGPRLLDLSHGASCGRVEPENVWDLETLRVASGSDAALCGLISRRPTGTETDGGAPVDLMAAAEEGRRLGTFGTMPG
eukprot:CAMPEP_0115315704 /NCGR_PEP_ID=MMETSP0270-20121206/77728_1 /TAXON_ID=71861 /ORGANISM="Scrippsiella trochoidea, Strain CCMP3099" /LENGTH=106 /DNA_ID=CAMNT_0002735055 /DNA_START=15 /DNA_END=331 /DNA_ORIENTATION=-